MDDCHTLWDPGTGYRGWSQRSEPQIASKSSSVSIKHWSSCVRISSYLRPLLLLADVPDV